jgi:hypothetical protein
MGLICLIYDLFMKFVAFRVLWAIYRKCYNPRMTFALGNARQSSMNAASIFCFSHGSLVFANNVKGNFCIRIHLPLLDFTTFQDNFP